MSLSEQTREDWKRPSRYHSNARPHVDHGCGVLVMGTQAMNITMDSNALGAVEAICSTAFFAWMLWLWIGRR